MQGTMWKPLRLVSRKKTRHFEKSTLKNNKNRIPLQSRWYSEAVHNMTFGFGLITSLKTLLLFRKLYSLYKNSVKNLKAASSICLR